jgi:DNA-binding MarR family transcriptional regulator
MVRAFLTEEEERVWYGLMETYDALLRALDARMLAEHNMPLSAFEALMHITHAEDGAISISDLAELVRLSPSQVSRIAIDLERKGLVQRQRHMPRLERSGSQSPTAERPTPRHS